MRVGHGAVLICNVFPVSLLRDVRDVPKLRGRIPWALPARAGAVR